MPRPPTRIAFDSEGDGPVRLVLLHGWPLNRSIWSEVVPLLAGARLRVVCPDLPGVGDSPAVDVEHASVESFADEVAEFIESFGNRPVAVAGHSFGGYVALALAERRPDLVAALGLVASRTGADSDAARAGRLQTFERVRASGPKALLPGLAERLVSPAAALKERAVALIEKARPDGVLAGLAAIAARPDRTPVFDQFPGPRLVVHGTSDALIPLAEAANPPRGGPAFREILPDVGHMPMWQARDAMAKALAPWVRQT